MDWGLTKIKSDVYPGKVYRVRLVKFSDGGCCTEMGKRYYRAQYNTSSESEFSLAPDLVRLFSDSKLYLDKMKEPVLYPKTVGYDKGQDDGYSYVSSGNLMSISDSSSFLRFQRSDLGVTSADKMSATRPILQGAGYIVNVFADTDKTVSFYDKNINLHKMIPREAQFCAFVPNVNPARVSIQPSDGCATIIGGQYAVYETSTDLRNVQSCVRTAKKSNGAIEVIPCCEEKDEPPFRTHPNNTDCLRFGGELVWYKAQFNRDYDYLVYLSSDYKLCNEGHQCSGTFERLNPSTWKDVSECESAESNAALAIWAVGGLCIATVCGVSVVGWYYRKAIATKFLMLRRV